MPAKLSVVCELFLKSLAALMATFGTASQLDAQFIRSAGGRSRAQAAPHLPSLPPATIDDKLQVIGQDVKGRPLENRLSVPVTINGGGPYRFIVDSGADTSVIGRGIARALDLPPAPPVLLNAVTARQFVERVKVGALDVGSSTTRDLQLPALLETDLGADGVLGIDALAEQRLMLDMETNAIKIEDGRVPWKNVPGEIVIRARRADS